MMSIRDVSTGANVTPVVTPKFSDTFSNQRDGGKFCPPFVQSHLNFHNGYIPVYGGNT